jgi:hypothetical protein
MGDGIRLTRRVLAIGLVATHGFPGDCIIAAKAILLLETTITAHLNSKNWTQSHLMIKATMDRTILKFSFFQLF